MCIEQFKGVKQLIRAKFSARKEKSLKTLRECAETERIFNSLCTEYKDQFILEIAKEFNIELLEADSFYYSTKHV